jgi:predicted CXXCH cytochrome family protein
MQVEITEITRRGAATRRRSRRVNAAERVRFGRDAGNDVRLADLRVELVAAELLQGDDGLIIRQLGTLPLRINEQSIASAEIHPGDKIWIGPYEVTIKDPPEGCEAAIEIDLVAPMGGSLAELTRGSRIGLEVVMPSRRVASWAGAVIVVIFCLAAPMAAFLLHPVPAQNLRQASSPAPMNIFAQSWDNGQFSNTHRHYAADCKSCHQAAFTSVPDTACLACHDRPLSRLPGHFQAAADIGPFRTQLAAMRCADCHPEHRGLRGMVLANPNLCLNCHRSLAEKAPKAGVRDIESLSGHPQFRVTVAVDPATGTFARANLDDAPRDRPAIKFAHAVHLVKGGYPALGYAELTCKDCHVLAPGGKTFAPITYKANCQRCHALRFDKDLPKYKNVELPWPQATVPHGIEEGLAAAVWNFYAGEQLQSSGGTAESPTFEPVAGHSKESDGAAARQEALSQVWQKAARTLETVVLDTGGPELHAAEDSNRGRGCFKCHYSVRANGSFTAAALLPTATGRPPPAKTPIVAAVHLLPAVFFPNAQFDHGKHAGVACGDCHPARFAESQRSAEQLGDVMLAGLVPEPLDIPGKNNCFKCHGAPGAARQTQTTCITCHVFHRVKDSPMGAKAAMAR